MRTPKTTTSDLRRINKSKALRAVFFEGPISRLQISEITKLSPATVTNVLTDLLADELVLEKGSVESDGGRPTRLLRMNTRDRYIVGVGVAETRVRTELFDLGLNTLESEDLGLSECDHNPEDITRLIVKEVRTLLDRQSINADRLIGMGVGLPGVVAPGTGSSVSVPDWGSEEVPMQRILQEALEFPVLLDNGVKAVGLAESMFGSARSASSAVILHIGTGLGAGIVQDGELFRGVGNSAGEWGHTTIVLDGEPCRCGKRGCLEAYVGAPGIIHRFQRAIGREEGLPAVDGAKLRAALADFTHAVREGKAEAMTVMEETVRMLGVGIGNLINVINPEVVAIGGWAGFAISEESMPELIREIERNSLHRAFNGTQIKLCELGSDSVTLGAATLVLSKFLETAKIPVST